MSIQYTNVHFCPYEEDIRARVGMAKAAFWQNKELMRRKIRN